MPKLMWMCRPHYWGACKDQHHAWFVTCHRAHFIIKHPGMSNHQVQHSTSAYQPVFPHLSTPSSWSGSSFPLASPQSHQLHLSPPAPRPHIGRSSPRLRLGNKGSLCHLVFSPLRLCLSLHLRQLCLLYCVLTGFGITLLKDLSVCSDKITTWERALASRRERGEHCTKSS